MKTRRNTLLAIGIFLILMNVLTDLAQPDKQKGNSESTAYNAGYLFGAHILVFIGVVLLILAYRAHRKLKSPGEKKEMENSIEQFGK